MHRPKKLLLFVCLALPSMTISLEPAEVCADQNGDHQAIRAAAKNYLATKQRGDFESLGKMWTPEGDYQDASGKIIKAQDLIRQQAATSAPESAPENASPQESSLRLITADVAIEDGAADLGTSADGSLVVGRFTAVWVKRDGRWLLDSLREATTAMPSTNNHLRELEWLIGEWMGKTDDSVTLVSSHWSEGGNYIVREFLVRAEGRDVISGSQRIGWDPVTGKIKSWMFDSNGGAGEGYWTRDGEGWVVESTEVMPDGQKSSASTHFTPTGEDRFLWEVKSAKVGDVNLPTKRVEFRRAAEGE